VHWDALTSSSSPVGFAAAVERVGAEWPVRIALFPFLALARLPFTTGAEFLGVFPAGVAILGANYLWVLRSDTAFEEASASYAEQQAARPRTLGGDPSVDAVRRRPPFTLRPEGRPEVALLWKNLILASRYFSWSVILRVLPVLVLAGFVISQIATTAADVLATACAVGAAGTALIGPQILRNDLRQDLLQLSMLKLWPVRGAAIVMGEVLAPTVLLTTGIWLLAAGAAFLTSSLPFDLPGTLLARTSYAAAAMVLAPGVILVQVVVQNGLALLFPAWMEIGARKSRGVDVMGQRMLVAGGLFAAVAVALLPAAAVAAVTAWSVHAVTGVMSLVLPAAAAAAVLLFECALAVEALGGVLDRMDATAVPAEE
jgi:ABC-2 type transport system permease protein